MDIRQLRYFITIAEEGSLSAASMRLRVAQPALSQHVVRIEQELGVSLLRRSRRGVSMTASGEILLKHAREICRSMTLCQEQVRESGSVLEGAVAIGLPSSVSMVLSVPLAETVRLDLPRVRLRAIEAMSGFIETWLLDETIDLAFLYEINQPRHFDARELMHEELCFFAPPDNWPLVTPPGAPAPLAAIASLELVLPSEQHGLRKTIERYASARHLPLNVVLEMDSLSQIKEVVARGSCFTILSAAAAHDRAARGELVTARIVEPTLTRPVHLVRKLAKPQTYVSRAVERIVVDVVRDLVRRGIWPISGEMTLR